MLRIFTIGVSLPGDELEYFPIMSDQSLLDADIILFEPSLFEASSYESYNGARLINETHSARLPTIVAHWNREIRAALENGKLIVILLAKPEIAYRYTGTKEHSGTGRSRATTAHVGPISSYGVVDGYVKAIATSGSSIRLAKDAQLLAPYWQEVGATSSYEVYIEGNFSQRLLETARGERVLGAAVLHSSGGAILFLPPIRYDEARFEKTKKGSGDVFWTAEALRFGKRLAASLVALHKQLKANRALTPPPEWANDPLYRSSGEMAIAAKLVALEAEGAKLKAKEQTLRAALAGEGNLRRLLYEQGHPLEHAVLEALELLGFQASGLAEGESEFDAVFTSPEGRCIGEVEGKDSRAINIDKMSQLERNLQEDFARDGIEEFAKGVLFGNANRLTHPGERSEFFTAKCLQAAKRAGIALVRTPDLFEVAKSLKESGGDEYATACRKAIFDCSGEVVAFPKREG